jgi:hypothetical protein
MLLTAGQTAVTEQRWTVLRHHHAEVMEELKGVLRFFTDELVPCESLDAYVRAVGVCVLAACALCGAHASCRRVQGWTLSACRARAASPPTSRLW